MLKLKELLLQMSKNVKEDVSHVSKLILSHILQQVGHSGRAYMLSKLHQRYWLSGANLSERRIIKTCVFCRRQQARAEEQKMAALPKDRVTLDLMPFTHVILLCLYDIIV